MRRLNLLYALLLAVPAAFLLDLLHGPALAIFLVSALGIIPLAALLGRATETLAGRLGPQLGGLLNATFGNAAELILGLAALAHGPQMHAVVKASLTGSIIGNALLVLGLSLLAGGLRYHRQTFDRVAASLQATLLVLAAIGLTIPSVLALSLPPTEMATLSVEVAAVLLATYLLSLVFSLITHRVADREMVTPSSSAGAPVWRTAWAVTVLTASTALVACLSEFLIDALEEAQRSGLLERLGMSEVFVGVVLVAVVGNAAENSAAVLMAFRNRVDLALNIAVGSSLQIALLVTPVLVFAGLFLGPRPLDLHFTLLEVLAVGASVIVVALVAGDGESHWMEGVLLLALYLILAMAFYHLPAAK